MTHAESDNAAVPTGKESGPVDVQVHNESQRVDVKWADGHTSSYSISRLRGYCPCAECRGHSGGGLPWLDNQVSAIFDVVLVGRYAVNFKFGDGHATGLFRWDLLRRLDPTEEARWGRPESFNRTR
ncbi:MAG: DUF971 domain-containing protein [Deltaproteobacteria bacterium]|nr:DUF971 domain-containing protein [Deltaproteobacteria bacterium]